MNENHTQTALITGGASGIGAGVASLLHQRGFQVVIADINDEAGQALASELGDQARYVSLDVTSESSWQALMGQLDENVSVLVNNAGTGISASIEDTTLDDWQRIQDLNARGVFLGCRFAVAAMKQTGGSIINIASALGKKALSTTCAYSASKAAVISLTESTALHCAEQSYPVRCNAVLPGFIDTPLLRNNLQLSEDPEGMLAGFVGLHPVNRLGTIEEVAETVAFLAGDQCSFITGASISIDGAMTI
ncbi:MAG: SDR family NAD(P)-dependent oxidoreductase [Pseudomonadales bacterium]